EDRRDKTADDSGWDHIERDLREPADVRQERDAVKDHRHRQETQRKYDEHRMNRVAHELYFAFHGRPPCSHLSPLWNDSSSPRDWSYCPADGCRFSMPVYGCSKGARTGARSAWCIYGWEALRWIPMPASVRFSSLTEALAALTKLRAAPTTKPSGSTPPLQ